MYSESEVEKAFSAKIFAAISEVKQSNPGHFSIERLELAKSGLDDSADWIPTPHDQLLIALGELAQLFNRNARNDFVEYVVRIARKEEGYGDKHGHDRSIFKIVTHLVADLQQCLANATKSRGESEGLDRFEEILERVKGIKASVPSNEFAEQNSVSTRQFLAQMNVSRALNRCLGGVSIDKNLDGIVAVAEQLFGP